MFAIEQVGNIRIIFSLEETGATAIGNWGRETCLAVAVASTVKVGHGSD